MQSLPKNKESTLSDLCKMIQSPPSFPHLAPKPEDTEEILNEKLRVVGVEMAKQLSIIAELDKESIALGVKEKEITPPQSSAIAQLINQHCPVNIEQQQRQQQFNLLLLHMYSQQQQQQQQHQYLQQQQYLEQQQRQEESHRIKHKEHRDDHQKTPRSVGISKRSNNERTSNNHHQNPSRSVCGSNINRSSNRHHNIRHIVHAKSHK